MPYKRYLVEFGMGADLHGMDVTKAAVKAVRDSISHCCLCGIKDILNLKSPVQSMRVKVKIGSTAPERVDREKVAEAIPFGDPEVEVVHGGISENGMHVPSLGDGDSITIANAVLTVYIDTDDIRLE